MITLDQADDVVGSTAYSADGSELGKVTGWLPDERTGLPGFAAVQHGLLGQQTRWVPILQALFNETHLTLPYPADQVRSAPSATERDGRLDPDDEARLRDHFGVEDEYGGPGPAGPRSG